MSETSTTSSGGIGFAGLLTILFIALKLTGVITWSWLWVLSPLWISFLLAIAFFALFFGIAAIAVLFGDRRNKKKAEARRKLRAQRDGRTGLTDARNLRGRL